MSSAETPVVPGRIYGLREWTVSDGYPPRLSPIFRGETWPPNGEPFEATCDGHSHVAPDPGCSCGIYAWHPRIERAAHVFPSRDWEGTVTGIVEAWGEVEVHADGFRAQYARPRWLVLPEHADDRTRERVAAVAAQYGAEVITCAGPHDLEAHCARLGLGLDPGAVSDLLPDPPEHSQPPYPPPSYQSGPRRLPFDSGDVLDAVAGIAGGVLGLIFIAGLILGIWHQLTHTSTAFTAADRALKIVDQAAFSTDDALVYVALVRNTSRSLTALDVSPRGRLWGVIGLQTPLDPANDDVVAPSIPPGQVAVVIDVSYYKVPDRDESYPKLPDLPIRRFAVRMHADSGLGRRRSPRVEIRAARADLHRCLVGATVLSGRRRAGIDVAIVARNRRGRVVWASSRGVAGPVGRGASRQTLFRIPPDWCRRSVRSVEAYPWWSAEELAPPRHRTARG